MKEPNQRSSALDHERGILEFVVESRRERYAAQLHSGRNRTKFLERLPHFQDWSNKYIVEIPVANQDVSSIVRLLRSKGAGDECWVISFARRFDARFAKLDEALLDIVGSVSGSVLSFVPGRLAYYEGEDQGTRFILAKTVSLEAGA